MHFNAKAFICIHSIYGFDNIPRLKSKNLGRSQQQLNINLGIISLVNHENLVMAIYFQSKV